VNISSPRQKFEMATNNDSGGPSLFDQGLPEHHKKTRPLNVIIM
jgi:hypothetical protein